MALRGRDIFQKGKPLLLAAAQFFRLFPMQVRVKLFEHYRGMKGTKGMAIRYALLKSIAKCCGDNVSVHPGVYLLHPQGLSIGDNVSIHPMCYFDATGGITIGNDVSIAHGCSLLSTSHQYDVLDVSIKDQPCKIKETVIRDNVWLGAKATIVCGITVESGAIVGANAVVTHPIPANAIAAGVPARVIKMRCVL